MCIRDRSSSLFLSNNLSLSSSPGLFSSLMMSSSLMQSSSLMNFPPGFFINPLQGTCLVVCSCLHSSLMHRVARNPAAGARGPAGVAPGAWGENSVRLLNKPGLLDIILYY